jgi:uncharacterized protein DUF1638
MKLEHKKRYKLLACEIFYREICLLAGRSTNIIDVEFLPKGLHDMGQEGMSRKLQEALAGIDTSRYEAILLAYGRCNDGVVGLKAREIPLVVPRAHDCITLFFGSGQAYEEYFQRHPGTYFRTTGWTERDTNSGDSFSSQAPGANPTEKSIMGQLGLDLTYEEYVAKYGKENAQYIMETLGGWEKNYKYLTYIDMGNPLDEEYADLARKEAQKKELEFKRLQGDLKLLRDLLEGDWSEQEFLVVKPGKKIGSDNEGRVLISVNP